MAGSLPLSSAPMQAQIAERTSTAARTIPWFIWCNVVAVVSSVVGGAWDISWHESVGRDTFWTPAHMLIYLCGVLSGLCCGYLILSTTFQKDSPLRAHSVSMWGFRGPLGAFICAWGGVAMITSAPFDNFWHNAYGLDVKILSPPHILLALGMIAIRFGTVVLILAELNRAYADYRARLQRLFLFTFMFLLGMTVGIMQEDTFRIFMHGAKFYLVVMSVAPIWMATVSRASLHRWAATIMTGLYTAVHLVFTWGFPLVPAEPKLGPVYQKITHLVPPDFPLLLIVSAIVFDLVRQRIGGWNKWAQSAVLGAASLASFFAVQWPFANFLMSPASRNWVFATADFPYFFPSTEPIVRNVFVPTESSTAQFALRMVLAFVVAVLTTRIGFGWGDWMRRVRR
jgi:hypothetical protein